MDKKQLEDVAAFIRDQRSNEGNFEALCQRLEKERQSGGNENYSQALTDVKEKAAEEYRKAKEKGGSAWPEFEKFAADFEKAVLSALKDEG